MADQRNHDFEQAALVHVDELFRTARRVSGGNRPAAEDLLQETLLRAWRSFDRFTPGTNCRAWLHRILTHVRAQRARRELRRRFVEELATTSVAAPAAASTPAGASAADHIRTAFNELPPHYQAVILLADVQGLSYREIAGTLDVPIGTVMSRLNRGRTRLRARFQELTLRHARVRRIVAAATAGLLVVAACGWWRPASLPESVAGAVEQHELCALRGAAEVADAVDGAHVSTAMPRIDLRRAGLRPISGHVCSGAGGRYAHVVFEGHGQTLSVLVHRDDEHADRSEGAFRAGPFAVAVARAGPHGGYIVTTADAASIATAGLRSLHGFFKEMRW